MVKYNEEISSYGDVMTREEWLDAVRTGCLIDYDGMGHPVKDGKMAGSFVLYPSQAHLLPKDATHVVWFNR